MKTYNELAEESYNIAATHGFHDKSYPDIHWLMLAFGEMGEMINADRSNKRANVEEFKERSKETSNYYDDDHIFVQWFEYYMKDTVEDELADVIIRLLDLAGLRKIDIDTFGDSFGLSEIAFAGNFYEENLKAHELPSVLFSIVNVITYHERMETPLEDYLPNEIVSLFGLADALKIDIYYQIEQKMRYNSLRTKLHGKKY